MSERESKILKMMQKESIIKTADMLLDFTDPNSVSEEELDSYLGKLMITAEALNTLIHSYFEA